MTKVKWPKVMNYNDVDARPILNYIDLGNGTLFRIAAFFCHGGRLYPACGLQISLERAGAFFFKIHPEIKMFYTDYVAEKLHIPKGDAAAIADWMNIQCGYEAPQQGVYNADYIREVEPYGLGMERALMPLVPKIID